MDFAVKFRENQMKLLQNDAWNVTLPFAGEISKKFHKISRIFHDFFHRNNFCAYHFGEKEFVRGSYRGRCRRNQNKTSDSVTRSELLKFENHATFLVKNWIFGLKNVKFHKISKSQG